MPSISSGLTYEQLYDRVLGALIGAALGDAMGAATEQHTMDEILTEHGGLLRELVAPGADTYSEYDKPGLITDDVSQMFLLAEQIIKNQGSLTISGWTDALVNWSQTSFQARGMGPTTRPFLAALAKGESTDHIATVGNSTRKVWNFGTTNGASMRVAPAGLVHPGDIEEAVRLAWISCYPTHTTQIAAAGAGAIAAGIAHALTPQADTFSVAQACLEGARLGEAIGTKEGRVAPGPSVEWRIETAINEGLKGTSLEDSIRRIGRSVGSSVLIYESAAAAIGLFVTAKGMPLESVIGGTNIGTDTDSTAAMAGALAGALRGVEAIPTAMRQTLEEANDEDIPVLAEGLTAIGWARLSK